MAVLTELSAVPLSTHSSLPKIRDGQKEIKSDLLLEDVRWAQVQQMIAGAREQEDLDGLARGYEDAISLLPQVQEVLSEKFRKRGVLLWGRKDYVGAIAQLSRSVETGWQTPRFLCMRGNLYYEAQDYDRALRDYDRAIELDPNYAQAYADRGNLHYGRGFAATGAARQKHYGLAKRDYDKALERDADLWAFIGGRYKIVAQGAGR